MKYSIITEDTSHKLCLTYREDLKFMERICHDTRRGIIDEFRMEMSWKKNARDVRRVQQIPRVCPTAVLRLQENGALAMKAYNGLLLLDVKPVVGKDMQEEVKQRAMALPITQAAFVGASGRSVKLLVRVSRTDGTLPQADAETNRFYKEAHEELQPLYSALLSPYNVVKECRGLMHAFLMPLDENPLFNAEAVAFRVGYGHRQPTDEGDWNAFEMYEKDFRQAVEKTKEELGDENGSRWDEPFLTRLAANMRENGMPREEAYIHTLRKLRYTVDKELQDRWRIIVDAIYDGKEDALADMLEEFGGCVTQEVMRLLEQRYKFRHNTIMGSTEYRRNTSQYATWEPVTERVINGLTMELQMSGLDVWDRDVKRYINSLNVRDYNMTEDYLFGLGEKWDGKDHIRQLARTIPTRTPQWPDWFHRFFLGMVAQWQQRNTRFGNAIVPLLISRQGYHKSDFCRQLLPHELASWGYTDSLSLKEERGTLQAMTQMLLICLDEFNQISPQKQEGFLKNIITMPRVKVRPSYARHIEDLPRMASFIATTNQADVLADASGSRRFVGIYIEGDIDTSQRPNYEQLYAQAVSELDNGERYWFDEKEIEAVMQHNRQFQLRSEAIVFFHEYFDMPEREQDGEWMTSASILSVIKQRARGTMKTIPSVNKFARELRALPSLLQKAGHDNCYYLVRKKP